MERYYIISHNMKIVFHAFFMIICLLFTSCEQENNLANEYVDNTNGWNYIGVSSKKVEYDVPFDVIGVVLHKVQQHDPSTLDVFFSVETPYYGGSSDYFDHRWLLNTQGETYRMVSRYGNSSEFPPDIIEKKLFIQRSKANPSGYGYIPDFWIPTADIDVLGTGPSEFISYNPQQPINGLFWNASVSFYENLFNHIEPYYFGVSASPRSFVASPYCYIYPDNYIIKTGNAWNGFNIAVGTKGNIQETFILSIYNDYSSNTQTYTHYLKVEAVNPTPANSGNRKTIFLFSKKISEIIPGIELNNSSPINFFMPLYYQYPSQNHLLYFVIPNSNQLYLLAFDMNTLEIKLKNTYNLVGTFSDLPWRHSNFKWIKDDPGCFINSGMRFEYASDNTLVATAKIFLFKNGNISSMQLPQFKSTIAPVVMDVNYFDGKLWLIAVDYNRHVHLLYKNY
jgi:hypothetical protein